MKPQSTTFTTGKTFRRTTISDLRNNGPFEQMHCIGHRSQISAGITVMTHCTNFFPLVYSENYIPTLNLQLLCKEIQLKKESKKIHPESAESQENPCIFNSTK